MKVEKCLLTIQGMDSQESKRVTDITSIWVVLTMKILFFPPHPLLTMWIIQVNESYIKLICFYYN